MRTLGPYRKVRYVRIPRHGVGAVDLLAPLEQLFVTSPFGPRIAPLPGASSNHKGIDYRAAIGTPVYSAAAGTVSFAGVQSGYGNVVVVDHGGGVQTKYAHLSDIAVAPGAAIAAGDQLGASGQTGNVTAPHLHFELDVNGVPVDPSSSIMSASLSNVVPGAVPSGFEADDIVYDTSGLPVDDTSGADTGNALEIGLFAGLLLLGLSAVL